MEQVKVNDRFGFPLTLDMQPYMHGNACNGSGGGTGVAAGGTPAEEGVRRGAEANRKDYEYVLVRFDFKLSHPFMPFLVPPFERRELAWLVIPVNQRSKLQQLPYLGVKRINTPQPTTHYASIAAGWGGGTRGHSPLWPLLLFRQAPR